MPRSAVVRIASASVLATAIAVGPCPSASAASSTATALVRLVETSSWSPPSPDPMGLAHIASTKTLVVADSEVDETKLSEGVNVWLADGGLAPTSAFATWRYTVEPADVAVGNGGKTLFFCDDTLDRIFQVGKGRDGRFGTKDDRVRSFSTRTFGSFDPEGLGAAPGMLFVTDGNSQMVYRLTSGKDGRFDGGRPAGDDRVRSFRTRSLGLADPEDAAYDRSTGHLFLISRVDRVIVEATRSGRLVTRVDISDSGIRYPSGVAVARFASDPAAAYVVVTDRGIDNNSKQGGDPNENDGRLFEFVLAGTPDTVPPAVPAGLTASASDAGIFLDWVDNVEPDLSGYLVARSDGAGGWPTIATLDPATSGYVDPSPGAMSTYRVTAFDAWGNTSVPAEVTAPG